MLQIKFLQQHIISGAILIHTAVRNTRWYNKLQTFKI